MSNLLKYIDHLQKKNALDLAFYPLTSLEKAIEANHVITCKENDEVAGYLWYGSARVALILRFTRRVLIILQDADT